jgi:dipeptidase E
MAARRLLLVSSSSTFGTDYLDHCESEILDLFSEVGNSDLLFVPYALADRDGYAETAQARFRAMGLGMSSVHLAPDPIAAVHNASGVFIGGGNTFRLLTELWRLDLLEPLRSRVLAGMPYLGTSAGSNVACPTIKTTNDMPIVQPPTFEALGLVSFQINAHYLDPDPSSTHQGETRDLRLREFHEENDTPVVALREGAMLVVRDGEVTLAGDTGGKIFARDRQPRECDPGSRVDRILA